MSKKRPRTTEGKPRTAKGESGLSYLNITQGGRDTKAHVCKQKQEPKLALGYLGECNGSRPPGRYSSFKTFQLFQIISFYKAVQYSTLFQRNKVLARLCISRG